MTSTLPAYKIRSPCTRKRSRYYQPLFRVVLSVLPGQDTDIALPLRLDDP